MQNSGETENELRPFLQRHDRPILERQRQGRLLLIPISGSGGCDAFSPSAYRSSPTSSSEPDAKMEPETILLRIGHRPVHATRSRLIPFEPSHESPRYNH